jgi:phosphonate transport system ATP-binding protein
MLRISNLTKTFGTTRALDDVSLDVPAGQFIGVIGRSGAGKSTMLRLINRLNDPTSGTIDYEGTDVTGLKGRELRAWRARCAMIFQQFNLVDRLDVLTNVLLGRANHVSPALAVLKLWSVQDRAMAMTALEMFDMGRLAAQRAGTLSGGQQQRVAICRALVQQPDVILADEPVASLDPRNTRLVMDALRTINREFGITVLVNLHSLDLARHYCDRMVGLASGKMVFDGPPVALTEAVARELYGLEADEVADEEVEADPRVTPLPARRSAGAL